MRQIIFGTDWWTDCDDAVALRLLTRYVKQEKIKLLGIAINACMDHSVASLKGFLRADGIKNIPLGIDLNATDFGGTPSYQKNLAAQLCPMGSNADAEDGANHFAINHKGKHRFVVKRYADDYYERQINRLL